MKTLMYGCAAGALLMGVAFQARAEIAVQAAPVHTVPAEDDDSFAAAPSGQGGAAAPVKIETAAPAPARGEPAVVKALIQAKAPPPAPVLTPEENAFFAVLGQRVTDAASAYESYVRRAGGIDPGFSNAASVQRAVKASTAYHPQQLEAGIVAYAALLALRDQAFVEGVRAVGDPAFADDLPAHPDRVLQVRGAREAAADVAGALEAQGAALIASGKAITKAAYDIQAQAWSKSPVSDPEAVLQGAKLSAGQMRAATTPSKEKLLASLAAPPQGSERQEAGSASGGAPDVVRGLALAAMAIMGRTGDGQEARYEALLHDASGAECLKTAKLNLNQCLAAAGPHYEDVYCAGRHAVSDTGKCIAAAAEDGVRDVAGDAAPPPRLQDTKLIGPEQAEAYGLTPSPRAEADDEDASEPAPVAGPALAEAPQAELQRAEPAPEPRGGRAPPAPRAYAQNDDDRPGYAQGNAAPQPYPQPQYAQPQPSYPQPQPYPQQAYPQQAYPQQAYQQPQPYPQQQAYSQYAQPQYPQAQYRQPQYQQPQYQQQQYQQPQYQQQQYPQPQYQQPQYQPPAYPQQQGYAPGYGGQQQPYYPQGPAEQGSGYYGR